LDVAAPVAVHAEPTAKTASAGVAEHAPTASQITSIRVDLEKVDRLVNMVGELVITEAMLRAQTRTLAVEQFAGLMRGIDELSQHTRDLQEAVMSVRMQPVKSIFARMPRVVRDISTQCGKDIRLVTQGENTEVDKTVIEQLSDPLMHMIRNSCDHGIETPDVRVDNGKLAQGLILLSANHRGGRIIIEIRDDGAGINRERVLAKAKEKNLVAADALLADEEIDNMIFMAGFSTAEKVTNISGRGVGMDVVKRNIEGMGGTVRVHNTPGVGSRFTISLPLTLAILDGMIVRVGGEHYIIPITSIIETLRPKAEAVHHVEGHNDVINVRGEFVSVVYLHRAFGIPDAQDDPAKALVVLVESNGQKMGLVVDELIGQQQVVIKSLEANADPAPGVSGATILGDGRVSLILDINDLAQIHHGRPSSNIERVA
jgi:two-component system chemotaxis sensor kinase CheA